MSGFERIVVKVFTKADSATAITLAVLDNMKCKVCKKCVVFTSSHLFGAQKRLVLYDETECINFFSWPVLYLSSTIWFTLQVKQLLECPM